MPPRVLTVLAGAPVGGAEAFFVALSLALSRTGAPVHAVLRPNASREEALAQAGVPHETAPFGGTFDFGTRRTLARAAAAFRPDVVLTFAGRASSFTPRGPYALIGRLGGYYNLRNFRHCDHLVCNAPGVAHHVMTSGWPKDRMTLIPNFPYTEDMPAARRADFMTPENVPLALALGRLHPAKGLDVLLKAAAQLPDLWVWIAGDGPERTALLRLARELGVDRRVRFLGWRNDRAALFKAADVCVYPSRAEPFGNVVVEAWANGIPLVAAASEGPSWLARNGEDAILCPVDDATALAAAIKDVISSEALARALVEAGKARVARDFSEEAVVRKYIDLFGTFRSKEAT